MPDHLNEVNSLPYFVGGVLSDFSVWCNFFLKPTDSQSTIFWHMGLVLFWEHAYPLPQLLYSLAAEYNCQYPKHWQ